MNDINLKNILLVEDEAIIALSEKKMLEDLGYNVLIADSGNQAIKVFAENQVDLILMDVDLGKSIDGTKVAEIILKENDVPIVFLSSHTEQEIVEKTEKITSYGYVVKNSGSTIINVSIKMAFKLFEEKQNVRSQKQKLSKLNEELEAANEELEAANEELEATNEELIQTNKELEESKIEVQKSENQFRSLYNSMLEGVCQHEIVYDSSGIAINYKIIDVNPQFEKTLNIKKEDIVGKVATEAYSVDEPPYLEIYAEVAKTGNPTFFEVFFPPMEKHFKISVFSPGKDKFATVFEDITTIKNTEIQLILEKEFTDTALDAQLDTFFLFEPSTGKAIRWNKAFSDISGYTDDEIKSQPAPISYYSPYDLERAKVFTEEVIKTGFGSIELELICKNGSKVPTEYQVAVIYDEFGGPKYIISIGRNITERKKKENELQETLQKNKELLSELQHRAKNSFALIYNMIALTSISNKSKKFSSVLEDLSSRVKAISEMYDLLYKTDSIKEVRLDEYLTNVISSIPILNNNISIDINFDEIILSVKSAIPVGLITVELLTNAIKYAFPNNTKGTISLSLKNKNKSFVLKVQDSGIGLPKNFKIENIDSMGLNIVKILNKQINGKLTIKNKNGTNFIFEVPVEMYN